MRDKELIDEVTAKARELSAWHRDQLRNHMRGTAELHEHVEAILRAAISGGELPASDVYGRCSLEDAARELAAKYAAQPRLPTAARLKELLDTIRRAVDPCVVGPEARAALRELEACLLPSAPEEHQYALRIASKGPHAQYICEGAPWSLGYMPKHAKQVLRFPSADAATTWGVNFRDDFADVGLQLQVEELF